MKDISRCIIKRHIESDLIIESVTMTDDYKTNNKEMKKLEELFEITSQSRDLCEEVYSELLKSKNLITLLTSSAECLKLNIYVEESIKILTDISNRKDIGIISFNAEMTLKEWQKQKG